MILILTYALAADGIMDMAPNLRRRGATASTIAKGRLWNSFASAVCGVMHHHTNIEESP